MRRTCPAWYPCRGDRCTWRKPVSYGLGIPFQNALPQGIFRLRAAFFPLIPEIGMSTQNAVSMVR